MFFLNNSTIHISSKPFYSLVSEDIGAGFLTINYNPIMNRKIKTF